MMFLRFFRRMIFLQSLCELSCPPTWEQGMAGTPRAPAKGCALWTPCPSTSFRIFASCPAPPGYQGMAGTPRAPAKGCALCTPAPSTSFRTFASCPAPPHLNRDGRGPGERPALDHPCSGGAGQDNSPRLSAFSLTYKGYNGADIMFATIGGCHIDETWRARRRILT